MLIVCVGQVGFRGLLTVAFSMLLAQSWAATAPLPSEADMLINKAQAAYNRGDAPVALELANKAIAAAPSNPQAYWVRGRIYSAHAETRIAMNKKVEQYDAVLEDLRRYPADVPAIVMGDFNTWEPNAGNKTIKLFSRAGLSTPFDGKSTFRRRVLFVPIELRLDWMWFRGLETAGCGINRDIEISDHWPLWTTVRPKISSAQR